MKKYFSILILLVITGCKTHSLGVDYDELYELCLKTDNPSIEYACLRTFVTDIDELERHISLIEEIVSDDPQVFGMFPALFKF